MDFGFGFGIFGAMFFIVFTIVILMFILSFARTIKRWKKTMIRRDLQYMPQWLTRERISLIMITRRPQYAPHHRIIMLRFRLKAATELRSKSAGKNTELFSKEIPENLLFREQDISALKDDRQNELNKHG